MSCIYNFNKYVHEGNYSALYGDKYQYDIESLSLNEPSPLSIFWKCNWYILSFFFSSVKIYDINALIAFVIIAVAGFLLARELGASVFISLLAAFLLTHLDVFYHRIGGHLFGLGTYYAPLFMVLSAIRAGKKPVLSRMIVFALFLVINFNANEYYGYFGFFFGCLLFAGYLLIYNKNKAISGNIIIRNILISGSIFFLLMCVAYPFQLGSKFFGIFNSYPDIASGRFFDWHEFRSYSLWNPATLFIPGFNTVKSLISNISFYNRPVFQNTIGEMTFRIGIIIPSVVFIFCLYYFIKSYSKKHKSDLFLRNEYVIWAFAAVIMVIFCLSPTYIFTLVPLTYKIAPMFRVGVRSLLYFDIALIALFVLAMQKITADMFNKIEFLHRTKKVKMMFKSLIIIPAIIIACFALMDVSNGNIFNKFNSVALPDTKSYDILNKMPEGFLVELPVYSPITDLPENNYLYLYNRIFHGKPIVNTVYTGSDNIIFRDALHELAFRMNNPDNRLIRELKDSGVLYIAANKDTKYNFSFLEKTSLLERIIQDNQRIIYKIRRDNSGNIDIRSARDSILERFIFNGSAIAVSFKGCTPLVTDKPGSQLCMQDSLIQFKSYYSKPVNMEVILIIESLLKSGAILDISSRNFSDEIKLSKNGIIYKKNIALSSRDKILIKLKNSNKNSTDNELDMNYTFRMDNVKIKMLSQKNRSI